MRRGLTIVEVLVALVLVAMVLGALFTFLGTTRRMNEASRGSAAVASALLIEESLAMDMRQLGVDPQRERVFDMTGRGLSFYRNVFDGKTIRLRPVRYAVKRTPAGNSRLERTEVGPRGTVSTTFDGILASVAFGVTGDPQSPVRYLRVTMTVLPEDFAPGSKSVASGVEQVLLARIPVPVQVANPELAPSCRLLPDGPLLPLDPIN